MWLGDRCHEEVKWMIWILIRFVMFVCPYKKSAPDTGPLCLFVCARVLWQTDTLCGLEEELLFGPFFTFDPVVAARPTRPCEHLDVVVAAAAGLAAVAVAGPVWPTALESKASVGLLGVAAVAAA